MDKSNHSEVPKSSGFSYSEALLNLLAVIHRDGGHYTEQHGVVKSYNDASSLISDSYANTPEIPDSSEAVKADEPVKLTDKAISFMEVYSDRVFGGEHGWEEVDIEELKRSLTKILKWPRPEPTQSPSDGWDGKDMPPVGLVCQGHVQDAAGAWQWLEVEILKHNNFVARECAVHVINHGILRWCDEFRPINSEEKHREEVIEHAMSYLGDGCTSKEVLSAAQQWAELGMLQMPNKE